MRYQIELVVVLFDKAVFLWYNSDMKRDKKKFRFRQSLFWDVDVKTIDPKKHAPYIIERILDFGELGDARWMVHHYPAEMIKDVLRRSRVVSDQSKALWSMVL